MMQGEKSFRRTIPSRGKWIYLHSTEIEHAGLKSQVSVLQAFSLKLGNSSDLIPVISYGDEVMQSSLLLNPFCVLSVSF